MIKLKPIKTAPQSTRIFVAGWMPQTPVCAGYWWWHEDMVIGGLALSHPKATHWFNIVKPVFPSGPLCENDKKREVAHGSRLTFVKETDGKKRKSAFYKCSCGNEIEADCSRVKTGKTKSCGCLRREKSAERAKKRVPHNMKTLYDSNYNWRED